MQYHGLWIGLRSQHSFNNISNYAYKWIDGSNTSLFHNWLTTPLVGSISTELCVATLRPLGWKWFQYNCNTTFLDGFICEKFAIPVKISPEKHLQYVSNTIRNQIYANETSDKSIGQLEAASQLLSRTWENIAISRKNDTLKFIVLNESIEITQVLFNKAETLIRAGWKNALDPILATMKNLEKLTVRVAGTPLRNPIVIQTTRMELRMEKIDTPYSTYIGLQTTTNNWLQLHYDTNLVNKSNVVVIIYKNYRLFSELPSESSLDVNTNIVSCSLVSTINSSKIQPTEFQYLLSNYKERVALSDIQCSYWNFNQSNWSTSGCNFVRQYYGRTHCRCNHLTHFAALMIVTNTTVNQYHSKILGTIGIAGVVTSAVFLLFTLIILVSLRNLRSDRFFIHKNLCLALLLANVSAVITSQAYLHHTACKVSAIIQHFLFTAAFTWMLVEGLHLYLLMVKVFTSGRSKTFLYVFVGWGIPVIIVATSIAIRFNDYGSNRICWLSIKNGLIWAFVGPVIAIITINFVIFILVARIICRSSSPVAIEQKTADFATIKSTLRGAVILVPILGLTWIFGVLTINEQTLFFDYIFVITNSLQGFFIFLFHCALNSEVQNALKNRIGQYDAVKQLNNSPQNNSNGKQGKNTGNNVESWNGHHSSTLNKFKSEFYQNNTGNHDDLVVVRKSFESKS
ncbi:uncharacterized protein TRIADDRAFT_57362 [Trichoplax adhaerens]|uniref:G-protein coupled receptors family 2 profile 2 domain-containing protein n=1 Tax=Trichoplax adhaerens TaxID=10228 RepID=B3RZ84_TRIAD|nr:hypothetical protein TRIADDRAFT_57362 [Trichoplax adhaerens]EDV23799.1 hypothetical protein TRIADDRAFT_57362 [Trichoplax adhaerens]|eukprot:XP_002113325.1 hypothetical protein TRIADDRAFT_57362 [Trichoplax adhaerens]